MSSSTSPGSSKSKSKIQPLPSPIMPPQSTRPGSSSKVDPVALIEERIKVHAVIVLIHQLCYLTVLAIMYCNGK